MIVYILISFLASIVGAICGIGGGVIIKPVLDVVGLDNVTTISFLSGCMVLAMSCYYVGRSFIGGDKKVDARTATPMAIGAAIGGVAGKYLFGAIKSMFENQNTVGAVQSVCLAVITAATLVYTIFKSRIRTRNVKGAPAGVVIGLLLGIMSSFLGIGGGPINLVVLFYFFGMDTKTAAANSLYIILFSQATSLISTLITSSVPDFRPLTLVLMVAGGIGGGIVGRMFNKRMDAKAVDKLFMALMALIICISVYNSCKYAFFI